MSDQLHELIKAMSSQEKRYFRVHTTAHMKEGTTEYLALFDAITKKNLYDEAQLQEQLKKIISAKRFAAVKHYLYHAVLESLSDYQKVKSVNGELNLLLREIEVLYSKSLYRQCSKLIERAKKIAERHEKFTRMLDLLEWEKTLYVATRYSGLDEIKLAAVFRNEKNLSERALQERECVYQGLKLALVAQGKGFIRNKNTLNEMAEIMRHPLMAGRGNQPSFKSQLFSYSSRSIYFLITGKLEKSLEYARKRIDFIEKHPERLKDNLVIYIQSINNFIITCEHLNDRHHEIANAIEKLQQLKVRGFRFQGNAGLALFLVLSGSKCSYYMTTAQFDKAMEIAAEIEKGLVQYKESVSENDRSVFYYFIACLFFGAKEYSQAGKFLNQLIQHPKPNIREDLQAMARIIFLLVNFEKGNEDFLVYLLQTTSQYFKRKKQLMAFESLIITSLREIILKKPDPRELSQKFILMKEKLEGLKEEPHSQQMLGYFDLMSWLESKIMSVDFSEVVRRKLVLKTNQ